MSSMAWAHRVLSPVTLHLVIGTVLCRCVTRPVAVADSWPMALMPGCSCPVAQSC
jgi:heme A synthase